MGRPKGSVNKDKEEPTPLEEVTTEMAKEEKATDSKTPQELGAEATDPELKGLCTITGIGAKTAEKLRDLGYKTILDIAVARAEEIASELKISFSIAKAWCSIAQERILARMEMKKAPDLDKEIKAKRVFLKTGSAQLNKLLGGGIPTMSITGLTGRFASGKTQICNEMVVECLGTLKEKAVYIETEPDTFHLDRLKEIANEKKLTCNWDDLYVCGADQIPTIKAQYLQYKLVMKKLEEGEKIRVVIIDSFNAKIRAGWGKSEMLPLRTRELAEHFNLMEFMAARYNVAWILTCQCIAPPRPDQGLGAMVKFGDTFYPVGGDYLLHSVNTWIGLTQIKTDVWKATLFDNSYLPRGIAEFTITKRGLVDGVR
jgi:RecA/RadA recombinase